MCKNWRTLISEPHFAKLHFEQAPISFMIWTIDHGEVSRTLQLLECEPNKFEIGSNNRVKLEPIFKPPLQDAKSFMVKRGGMKNKFKRPFSPAKLVLEKNNENTNRGRQKLFILLATKIVISLML